MINFARISRPFLIGLSSAFCLVFPQASAETVEAQQKVNSLAAIVIGVSDIESAMAFYTSVIGLELVREVNADEYLERILEVPGGAGNPYRPVPEPVRRCRCRHAHCVLRG